MCGRCEGEPYRGVKALFNGDLQRTMQNEDREGWLVISSEILVHLGETALADGNNPLLRLCEQASLELDYSELKQLVELSKALSRPIC